MRPIKFRGKAVMSIDELDERGITHTNGWIYGNLINNGDHPYIVGDIVEATEEYIVHEQWVPVIPESVGQYTGLTDRYDVEFYEGDIGYDDHLQCYGIVTFDDGAFYYEWENMCDLLFETY